MSDNGSKIDFNFHLADICEIEEEDDDEYSSIVNYPGTIVFPVKKKKEKL